MIIKKYQANNVNEAIIKIRQDLGKEAVIISQRKVRKPGIVGFFSAKIVEVTAAIENSLYGNEVPSNESKKEYPKEEVVVKNSIENLKKIMTKEIEARTIEEIKNKHESSLKNEVLEIKGLLNKVIENTGSEEELLGIIKDMDIDTEYYEDIKRRIGEGNLRDAIKEVLKEDIEVSNGTLRGKVVLVGPTGVGKTTTIAKLAGRLSLIENKKVGLITVDTYRIGAVEQLKTYAEIMNIPFKVVITIKEMEEAVYALKDCDVVLIDTTGRSSKNAMQLSELRAYIEKAQPDYISLVVSAITKNKDIKVILNGYKELGYKDIIVSKLDETSVYGTLYNISRLSKKPISFITTGQNVPDDIKSPSKDEIVQFITGEEVLC